MKNILVSRKCLLIKNSSSKELPGDYWTTTWRSRKKRARDPHGCMKKLKVCKKIVFEVQNFLRVNTD